MGSSNKRSPRGINVDTRHYGGTPGTLGQNDHGDPNVIGHSGDTPGPVGWNDHAEVILAYDSWGHQYLNDEALKMALKNLPPELDWIRRFLNKTDTANVYRDMTDIFEGGHWNVEGQRHHFMRHTTQSAWEAYRAGVDWVHDKALKAAENLHRVWKEKLGYYDSLFVSEPLGDALHALQDSFAEGHVTRKKDDYRYVITDIQVYDAKNQQPAGDWPGHAELDKRYQSDLGDEAALASAALILNVIKTSLQTSPEGFNATWKRAWEAFEDLYFATTIPKTIKI